LIGAVVGEESFAFDLCGKFFFGGKESAVFGCEELFVALQDRVVDDGFLFVTAEDDADGGVVVRATL
jgi:hypothetical protein